MAITGLIPVQSLSLDLHNFRTVTQPNEDEAVKALISINPDWFWGLMDSLLDDGYLPTESIIAINDSSGTITTVKEGNRRVASLKVILGYIDSRQMGLPTVIADRIATLSPDWINANSDVPCTVYDHNDSELVNKIINRTHGKNEKAGRYSWPSVAKARYNRDINGANEYGLTLLEKYLDVGRNVNAQQRERWAGDYTISVLDAAIARVATRLGASNVSDLVSNYPNINYRDALENMLSSIGQKQLSFDDIRNTSVDFAHQYGIPSLPASPAQTNTTNTAATSPSTQGNSISAGQVASNTVSTVSQSPSSSGTNSGNVASGSPSAVGPSTSGGTPSTATPSSTTRRTTASASNTPKSVLQKMRLFRPRGNNREKIVDLKNEILRLNIEKSPIAFCFLLRSLFEISAKVYCTEHNIPTTTGNGNRSFDRKLADLLTDATNQLTQHGANQTMNRQLTGALQQLTNHQSILSVTSMNQLVHNPSFSVIPSDVCVLFHNIYPLLENMN